MLRFWRQKEPKAGSIEFPDPDEVFVIWESTLYNYFDYNYRFSLQGIEIVGESPKMWVYPDGRPAPYTEVDWPPPDVDKPAIHQL